MSLVCLPPCGQIRLGKVHDYGHWTGWGFRWVREASKKYALLVSFYYYYYNCFRIEILCKIHIFLFCFTFFLKGHNFVAYLPQKGSRVGT